MSYQPIDCNYYDELVLFSMRKQVVEIVYHSLKGNDDNEYTIHARITDLFTKSKEEFMQLDNGQQIRLDQIIRVEDKILNKACQIKNIKSK